ncbi:PilZ domain-containing protein [Myxococcota bacterium]|nr:PilZ domain-containing protein [Myxococcota bacterium]
MSKTEIENSLHFLKTSRRSHQRFSYETVVTLHIAEKDIPGSTSNLSLGGAFVNFEGNIQVGDTISLTLTLPGVPKETVPAEVKWVCPRSESETGCGLSFMHLSDMAMNAIINLCANEELRRV